MQIERLEYFMEVARSGSIKRASENINISQQALSQSMAQMEKELGVELFKRGQKGTMLTKTGEEVHETALLICEAWANLMMSLNEKNASNKNLCISIAPFLEVDYYAKVLAYIKRKYPKTQLNVVNNSSSNLMALLSNKTVDLAIASFEKCEIMSLRKHYPSVSFIHLEKIILDVLVNKSHYLAQYPEVSFAQLKEESIVMESIPTPFDNFFLEKLKENGFTDIKKIHSQHTIQEMVANNLAVSFGAKSTIIANEYQDHIVRIKLTNGEIGVIAALTCKDKVDDLMLKNIIGFLQEK